MRNIKKGVYHSENAFVLKLNEQVRLLPQKVDFFFWNPLIEGTFGSEKDVEP